MGLKGKAAHGPPPAFSRIRATPNQTARPLSPSNDRDSTITGIAFHLSSNPTRRHRYDGQTHQQASLHLSMTDMLRLQQVLFRRPRSRDAFLAGLFPLTAVKGVLS